MLAPRGCRRGVWGHPPRRFGDYELLERIGQGGMGVVYKARQLSLNRLVALKMILAGQLASPLEVERFRREGEAAANLDHPKFVPVYEVDEHQGQHYFSMALVEGPSLADRLAEGPLAPDEAAALVGTLAEAVQYAHDRGVVHRDLKPGNVLLEKSGQPRITDFGLAKRVAAADRSARPAALTVSGTVMGTPGYMPPEQAQGRTNLIGPLADVYSLGAILFAALTGRAPLEGRTPLDTLVQVLEQEPVRPSRLNPKRGRELDTICLKCLEKPLARRYPSAKELATYFGLSPRIGPREGSVRIWSVDAGRPIASLQMPNAPEDIALSPAGNYLACVDGQIHLIQVPDGKRVSRADPADAGPMRDSFRVSGPLAFTFDGRSLIAVGTKDEDHYVFFLDVPSGRVTLRVPGSSFATAPDRASDVAIVRERILERGSDPPFSEDRVSRRELDVWNPEEAARLVPPALRTSLNSGRLIGQPPPRGGTRATWKPVASPLKLFTPFRGIWSPSTLTLFALLVSTALLRRSGRKTIAPPTSFFIWQGALAVAWVLAGTRTAVYEAGSDQSWQILAFWVVALAAYFWVGASMLSSARGGFRLAVYGADGDLPELPRRRALGCVMALLISVAIFSLMNDVGGLLERFTGSLAVSAWIVLPMGVAVWLLLWRYLRTTPLRPGRSAPVASHRSEASG